MSQLQVFDERDGATPLLDTSDGDAIAAKLATIGVRFERWRASRNR